MANGYFFIDPRTCEDVFYVPRVFEVRCFEGRELKYSVSFNKNKLEKYAIADSAHREGAMWGVKNGMVVKIEMEGGYLEKICRLCEAGDKKSMNEAEEIAIGIFDMATYGLRESVEDIDDEDILSGGGFGDGDGPFDIPEEYL